MSFSGIIVRIWQEDFSATFYYDIVSHNECPTPTSHIAHMKPLLSLDPEALRTITQAFRMGRRTRTEESENTLSMSDEECKIIIEALAAVTPSGGGSSKLTLLHELCKQANIPYESLDMNKVVEYQRVAMAELTS